jgi:hypothetical protein
MIKASNRALAARPSGNAWIAGSVTAVLSLALLLAPHAGNAAVPAKDADVIGKWISDKNDPALDYAVAAGTAQGTLRLMVPAKAIGQAEGETVILQRAGLGEFATAKGSALRGRFVMTGPRRAEFKAMQNDKKGFHIIYQLLEKP